LNGKVKCIIEFNPGRGATAGKTYEVKDGRITYDNGMNSFGQYESIEHLNSYNTAQFEEVKRGRPRKEGDGHKQNNN